MSEVMTMDAAPRDRLRKVAVTSGYVTFFLLALVVAIVLTFPTRQLKGFIEGEARKAGYRLRIESLSLRGLGSATLEGVDVTFPEKKSGGKDEDEASAPLSLHLDSLSLSVSLWRALSKREIDVSFDLEVGGGVLEGGHALLLPLGGKDPEPEAKDAKGRGASPGPRRGYAIDLEVEAIDRLPLRKMGLDRAAFAFQKKLRGDLDGLLSGKMKVHYGGTMDDLRGEIDLTLTDAVLRNPSVELPKMGQLALTDLRMGTLTAKVTLDEKAKIAILKGARGSDKSTAIALEGVDVFGPDIELVVEERSHVLIPPGPAGMKLATLQVHFAFALPQSKESRAEKDDKGGAGDTADKGGAGDAADGGGKDGGGDAETADRAKWSSIMELAGDKLKPYIRSGYVGMTCTGALARPNCAPALPQVTVGTRRKARSEAAEKAKEDKADRPEPASGATDRAAAKDAEAAPPVEPRVAEPPPGKPEQVELKPAMDAPPTLPRAAPALGGPSVEQNNSPRFEPAAGRGRGPRPSRPENAEEPEGEADEEGQEPAEGEERGRGARKERATDEEAPADEEGEERPRGDEATEEGAQEPEEAPEGGEGGEVE
ncbi:MAG: type II secretion system protein GspN [Deltaproteobacteria bacterium]|nr:type II secretion system protein GspN [Deltaproteobacteria bacterium]